MRNDRLNFFLVMMHKIKDHAITALDAGSATSGSIAKRLLSTSGAVLTLGILVVGNASADTTVTDIVAPWGCSMPHCSPGLSDDTGLESALSNDVIDVWRDTEVNGSFVGPGCVANHNTAVCSFQSTQSKPVEIRAYDVDGIPLWSSEAFGNQAFYSAPIIGPDGGLFLADSALPDVVLRTRGHIVNSGPYFIYRFDPGYHAQPDR